MALINCPDCKKEVSDQATACPFCGRPITPSRPRWVPEPPKPAPSKGVVAGIITALAFGAVIYACAVINTSSAPQASSCNTDWKLCADNADIVNNYDGWHKAEYECESEARQQAKYGTPEFPWGSFGKFIKGNDYKTNGKGILIEPDAKFSNGFGAMVHARVECSYDLGAKRVLWVHVAPAR